MNLQWQIHVEIQINLIFFAPQVRTIYRNDECRIYDFFVFVSEIFIVFYCIDIVVGNYNNIINTRRVFLS